MRSFLRSVVVVCVGIFLSQVSFAQCDPVLRHDSAQFIFDDAIVASAKGGNILYVGGAFRTVGKYTGKFSPVNIASGSPELLGSYPKVNGNIYVSIPDGLGGWIIGGGFSMVGSSPRAGIAQINALGQVTSWNPTANGSVRSMALIGNTLYVGGDFTIIGGQTRNHVAAINLTTGVATPWNPDGGTVAGNTVYAITINGTNAYVGGIFTNIGGQLRNRIAEIDLATGLSTGWNPNIAPATAFVKSIVKNGSNVYIGGSFGTVGGQIRNNIAAVDAATGVPTSWDPNINDDVNNIIANGTELIVGGAFSLVGGQSRARVAIISITTALPTSFSLTMNGADDVRAMSLVGNTLYIGGNFDNVNGTDRYHCASINIVTGTLNSMECHSNGPVNTINISGGSIYVGGEFTSIGRKLRNYIAAIDMTADTLTSWAPSPDNTVEAITTNGSMIYFGGDFINVNNVSRIFLAAVDVNGTLNPTWNPGLNSSSGPVVVYTMQVDNNIVFIDGLFDLMAGTARDNVGAVNATTGAITPWYPSAQGPRINAMVPIGSTLYMGGQFPVMGTANVARQRFAAVDMNTGATPTSWNPNAGSTSTNTVNTMVYDNGILYAGGKFATIGGQAHPNLATIDITSGLPGTWNPAPNNEIKSLAVNNGIVYCLGSFSAIGTNALTRNRLASVDATTGSATTWNHMGASIVTGLAKIEVAVNKIYVMGDFDITFPGGPAHKSMAIFDIQAIAPMVTIAGNSTICAGTSTTYTATTTVTGATYQWQVNGGNVGTNSSTYSYTPSNNDQVQCIITVPVGSCYTATTATSNSITVAVTPNTTPTISVTGSATVCTGVSTTYTATTNITGGTYQWQVNGSNVGTNSATYTFTPTNGNQVKCIITVPGTGCFSATTATSNTITISVVSSITPTASITTGTTTVCAGTSVTYTATTNVTGGTYQWQVNGSNVGTNSATYTHTPANNNQITCIITVPGGGCYTTNSVTSNTITMTVTPSTTPTISVVANPGSNVCSGTPVTYTATTNITGGTYQWQVNGVNAGTNSNSYTYTPANNDQVKCIITVPGTGCFTATTATSNIITMTVGSQVTPTISVAGNITICGSVNTTYTATTNITGGTYQWQVNGTNAGTNSSTYSYSPANGDVVKCIITVPAGCYSANNATSNDLTITVTQPQVPTISVSANPTAQSIGNTVNLTATVGNAGTNYSIDWKNNGTTFDNTVVPSTSYVKGPGQDNITAIITPVGCYTVATSNNEVVNELLSVGSVHTGKAITVYPNPFNSHITITNLDKNDVVVLMDATGKKIMEWKADVAKYETTINVNNVSAGIYMLRVTDNDGKAKLNTSIHKK